MAKPYNTLGTVAPGDVLRANSGTASYNGMITNVNNLRVPPCCVVERTDLSVADGANAAVAFTSAATIDTEAPGDPMHSTSVNNTRITARTAGIYAVTGNLQPTGGELANASFTAQLRKNNTNFCAAAGFANIYINPALVLSGIVSLTVGDYVELWYFNDNTTGTAVTVIGRLQAVWLGQVS